MFGEEKESLQRREIGRDHDIGLGEVVTQSLNLLQPQTAAKRPD